MYKRIGKRLLDLFIAIPVALGLSPVLAIIAIAIKIDSPGPVVHRSRRVGFRSAPYDMLKFRSMVQNASQTGPWFTQPNDPRITRAGRFLRKTSLDELPQIWNIIRGDMSVVGPRPDAPQQLATYSEEERQLRFSVRPGLTGLAQVMGRSTLSAEERRKYDLDYAESVSFSGDLSILLRTFATVLTRRGSW
ncbi:MAG: sugar transferase [Symbiobacteriia bacterium]